MPYATGSAGLAPLVRGSSRRIMIMRLRHANIRLINRRSNLPRLLLALCSTNGKSNGNNKNDPTDSRQLTGSLHIRAVRLNRNCARAAIERESIRLGVGFRAHKADQQTQGCWNAPKPAMGMERFLTLLDFAVGAGLA